LVNPVNTDALKVIVLEVNNTFGEKHLYILDRDSETDISNKLGYVYLFINNLNKLTL